MIPGRRRREGLDFSFTAINVVLLLLFYFIVTGTISTPEEYSFEAPITDGLPVTRLPRPLLAIDAAGTHRLDGIAVEPERMGEALFALRASLPDRPQPLHILAARDGDAAGLLEAARLGSAAGFDVRIVTQPDFEPQP